MMMIMLFDFLFHFDSRICLPLLYYEMMFRHIARRRLTSRSLKPHKIPASRKVAAFTMHHASLLPSNVTSPAATIPHYKYQNKPTLFFLRPVVTSRFSLPYIDYDALSRWYLGITFIYFLWRNITIISDMIKRIIYLHIPFLIPFILE